MKRDILSLLAIIICNNLFAQVNNRTVGTTFYISEKVSHSYTLFSPEFNKTTYLINNCGEILHTWESQYPPGNAVYLMEDASLFRAGELFNRNIQAGGAGGIIEKISWDNQVEWSFTYNNEQVRAHHDFQVLPNGNVLVLAWEVKTREEAIANGRNPDLLSTQTIWPEHIVEIEPTGEEGGNIVWQWHAWDHLIQDYDETKSNFGSVANHPEKININHIRHDRDAEDWMHANSINYNPALDQIMLSIPFFNEIWIIDHSITTEEARGEKGDLLFRWGNSKAYKLGDTENQKLFFQHNAHWIPEGLPDAGQILVFNNGNGRTNVEQPYSSVLKVQPVFQNGEYQKQANGTFSPEEVSWEYQANPASSFYARFLSGAQQLPNGNLLITDGAHGKFFEINESKEKVWEYVNPITLSGNAEQGESMVNDSGNGLNIVFRSTKYPTDYLAFVNKDLSPNGYVETDNTLTNPCMAVLGFQDNFSVEVFPNPTSRYLGINGYKGKFTLCELNGKILIEGVKTNTNMLDLQFLKPGMYVLQLDGNTPITVLKK